MQPSDLTSNVPRDILHERGELLRGLGRQEQVGVVAQDHQAVNLDSVPALSTSDDTDDQIIGAGARTK